MSVTLEAILKYPKAPLLIAEAQKALADEARRRHEFREWVDESMKAEFIQGEIVVHSPVKRRHSIASELLFRTLSFFADFRGMGEARLEKAMVGLTRNDYEPDICFWKKEKTANFNDDTLIYPAPDFVVEVISKRTQRTDRSIKFQDYALHGIREYWIIDPFKKIVEQYGLLVETDTEYLPYGKFTAGEHITSIVLPEFSIPVKAIFDSEANLKAIAEMMGK
jgi:Uma2 family endonuclease